MKRTIIGIICCMLPVLCGCTTEINQQETRFESAGISVGNTVNDTVNDIVNEKEIVLQNDSEYPEYYRREVITTINETADVVTADSVSYIFITDLHLDSDAANTTAAYRQLNAVVDVANNTDIDFVCVGGDLYDGRHAQEGGKEEALDIIRSVSEVLTKCNKPVFILQGNHDDNSFSAQIDGNLLYDADYIINKEEWYNATMAYFDQYASAYERGYFYYDIHGKNARVICLNMSDSDDTVVDGMQKEMGMYFYGYKDKQIDWLLNTAMSDENLDYYIMSHDGFEYPEGYSASSNRETLRNILEAANNHQNYDDGKFSKDFSKYTGKPVLYNCGHLHLFRAVEDAGTGGLTIINSEKAKISRHGVWGNFGASGYTVETLRNESEVTEALFDVVVSKKDTIDFIRFGSGDNRILKLDN